jgi:hypothetical protein
VTVIDFSADWLGSALSHASALALPSNQNVDGSRRNAREVHLHLKKE